MGTFSKGNLGILKQGLTVNILLLTLLFICQLSYISTTGIMARSDYNDSCSKTLRCKSQAWLSCNYETNLCQCSKPDEMIYSETQGKCLVLLGERCKYGFDESGEDVPAVWYEKAECGTGAVCGLLGVCGCPQGFYEIPDKNECVPAKSHGEPCQGSNECNAEKLLVCDDGECKCYSERDMAFNTEQGVCLSRLGKECGTQGNISTLLGKELKCPTTADCSGICACKEGTFDHEATQQCVTVRNRQGICSRDIECDAEEDLSCVHGQCDCNPGTSIYNSESFQIQIEGYSTYYKASIASRVCVRKAEQRCQVNYQRLYMRTQGYGSSYGQELGKDKYCMPGTTCQSEICKCGEGFEVTSQGLCGVKWGAQCTQDKPCSDKYRCNKRLGKGTRYADSICSCPSPDDQDYDSVAQTCRGLVGSRCSKTDPFSCISDAECANAADSDAAADEMDAVCRCKDGFIENKDMRCEISFGNDCTSTTAVCDSIANLECRSKTNDSRLFTCQCRNDMDIYEADYRKCSRSVGARCHKSEDCSQHAECVNGDELIRGTCACSDGFKTSNNGCIGTDVPFLPFLFNSTT